MEVEIAAMAEAHLGAVMEIERYSFIAPWSKNLFCHELSTHISRSFVALVREADRQQVAAYMCSWIIHEEGNILKFACHPQYRRQGVGRLLLRHGLQDAWRMGARIASLEVRPSNTGALLFYTACGFVRAGVRKGYYQETAEDAVIMEMELTEHNEARSVSRQEEMV
jgi:[ribosomal protein S18]-alanine N-acetyltransferase